MVERILGKDEVTSSILVIGSSFSGSRPSPRFRATTFRAKEFSPGQATGSDTGRGPRPVKWYRPPRDVRMTHASRAGHPRM